MKPERRIVSFLIVALVFALSAGVVIFPSIDLATSGLFFESGKGFPLANNFFWNGLHFIAYGGARLLAAGFFILFLVSFVRGRPCFALPSKAWAFLLLGLLLGPGLIANVVFKDHFGRARPREIVEFGGSAHFTPALVVTNQCDHNCSFVSGDGSFGFFLPAFAYVVRKEKSRQVFWRGMGLGCLFALSRIVAGAHFLSDTIYAALSVQAVLALTCATMYGRKRLASLWSHWLFLRQGVPGKT